jgi:predicted N-formylglutamate amidohydrolase
MDLFEYLAPLADYSKENTISRLLIECNRSLHHPQLFSEFSNRLAKQTKHELIAKYYLPYRTSVESSINEYISSQKQVLHISLHSFTPELNGVIRQNDIGLLYDPKRKQEKEFCLTFKDALIAQDPTLKIRANYPYLGSADGFTTHLRKQFPENYLGIELELNQGLVQNNGFPLPLKILLKRQLQKLKNL